MAQPNFWENSKQAKKIVQKLKDEKNVVEPCESIWKELIDLKELIELVEEKDTCSLEELKLDLETLDKRIEKLEFQLLLCGEHDKNNTIVNIHAGAGGAESCDWAGMLFRMYSRWAGSKNYEVKTIDFLPGDGTGVKNATFLVVGNYAYGHLKAERGVHRLVRISPFDTNRRRHTSFASVDVLPDIEEEGEIKILPQDLKIDTYRASGPGGQHVNVTDSAVRITHIQTGIVVQCQNDRSQHKNKAMAMKVLKSKLYELESKERIKKLEELNEQKQEIAWGSQIRSYILHPYTMIKDHRTNLEVGNASAVLDGDIDEFIESYLKSEIRRQKTEVRGQRT